jgi:hypothetical protein
LYVEATNRNTTSSAKEFDLFSIDSPGIRRAAQGGWVGAEPLPATGAYCAFDVQLT